MQSELEIGPREKDSDVGVGGVIEPTTSSMTLYRIGANLSGMLIPPETH